MRVLWSQEEFSGNSHARFLTSAGEMCGSPASAVSEFREQSWRCGTVNELPPVAPAAHMDASLYPSCSTSGPAPCQSTCSHMGALDGAPASWFQPSLALVMVAVWGVNRWMEAPQRRCEHVSGFLLNRAWRLSFSVTCDFGLRIRK